MYSFDVFDTLITRKTATPRGVFLVMQKELQKNPEYGTLASHFAIMRYEAEHNAERFIQGREICLEDIYCVLGERCHLTVAQQNELMELEVETEIKCAISIANNINKLKELLETGEKVVLISDMYLGADAIRRILCSVDDVFGRIKIYVSCDCNRTKFDGSLYTYVKESEQVSFDKWVHYGDNIVSDHNVPEFFGIKPVLVSTYTPSNIEKFLSERFRVEHNYDVQLFLGLAKECDYSGTSTAFRLGIICGGSVLFPYVRWIIDEAIYRGIEKLLFMSRDGYILKQIADEIIEAENIPIKTEYVYVSKNVLRDNGENGKMSVEYLSQFVEDETFALVDFQGTGKSIINLASKTTKKIYGFYYLLNGNPHGNNAELLCYTYIPIKSGLVEIVCRAPHGAVVAYEKKSNEIVPILSEIPQDIWEKSGLFEYVRGVLSFIKLYISGTQNGFEKINLKDIGEEIIRYCENTPDNDAANFIGNFPHSEENGDEIYGFAPKVNENDLNRIYGIRGDEDIKKYYKGSNIEYSFKISGIDYRKHLMNSFEKGLHKKYDDNAEKIILYAAGKYGFEAMYRLSKSKEKRVVAWVDMNYQSYRTELIESPSVITSKEYDYIVVCLYDKCIFNKIRNMLESKGVEPQRIVWICDYWKGFFV